MTDPQSTRRKRERAAGKRERRRRRRAFFAIHREVTACRVARDILGETVTVSVMKFGSLQPIEETSPWPPFEEHEAYWPGWTA